MLRPIVFCRNIQSHVSNKLQVSYFSKLPIRIPSSLPTRLRVEDISEDNLIFIDTETTGLEHNAQLVQLAAITNQIDSSRFMDVYCLPKMNISPDATRINGFSVREGQLYYKNEPVETMQIRRALIKLLELAKSTGHHKSVLVAHNATFDAKVILSAAISGKMMRPFRKQIAGFVDTLSLFCTCYPELCSYKQSSLVSYFIGGQYNEHNAKDDVHMLYNLYRHALSSKVAESPALLAQASFTTQYAIERFYYEKRVLRNVCSLQPLIMNKIIKKAMAQRLAEGGMSWDLIVRLVQDNQVHALKYMMDNVGGNAVKHYEDVVNFVNNDLSNSHLKE